MNNLSRLKNKLDPRAYMFVHHLIPLNSCEGNTVMSSKKSISEWVSAAVLWSVTGSSVSGSSCLFPGKQKTFDPQIKLSNSIYWPVRSVDLFNRLWLSQMKHPGTITMRQIGSHIKLFITLLILFEIREKKNRKAISCN